MACLIIVQALSGCSTVYYQQWKRAGRESEATSGITGRWEGTLQSNVNQHTGKLRCIVTETDTGNYDFHYWARWSLFAGTYHLYLPVQEENSVFSFEGSKNLGKLVGGKYSFEGSGRGDSFDADYKSKYDHGRFIMTRIAPRRP